MEGYTRVRKKRKINDKEKRNLTAEDEERHEKRLPEPIISFHKRRSKTRKRPDLDTSIVKNIDAIIRDGWIYNNTFARLGISSRDEGPMLILIPDHRRHIGLDASSTQADDGQGNGKGSKFPLISQRLG